VAFLVRTRTADWKETKISGKRRWKEDMSRGTAIFFFVFSLLRFFKIWSDFGEFFLGNEKLYLKSVRSYGKDPASRLFTIFHVKLGHRLVYLKSIPK
jgi:hypothetical protein